MNKVPEETGIEVRRKKILELLERDKKLRVADLSEMFSISEVTIRLDLTEMEKNGLLERVHGGAVSTNKLYYRMDFDERLNYYSEEDKLDVARAAAGLIKPYDTVMINSGTVAYLMAKELKTMEAVTVVTNSLPVAQELSGVSGFNIILLGGNYNTQYKYTYGSDAVDQLAKYKARRLVLSVDGISVRAGLTTHYYEEAEVCRAMVEHAKQVIVLGDIAKVGCETFVKVAPLEAVDVVVTNKGAKADEIKEFRKLDIDVIEV